MTSARSSVPKRRNLFKTEFLLYIRRDIKIVVLLAVFQLLSIPALIYSALCSQYAFSDFYSDPEDYWYDTSHVLYELSTLSPIFIACSVCCIFLLIVRAFSYLFKKEEADMYLSLPGTMSQRFFAATCAVLVKTAVTFLLTAPTAIAVYISYFNCYVKTDNFDNEIFAANLSENMIYIFLLFLIFFLFVASFSIFTIMLCGRVFEATVFTAVFAAAIPIITVLIKNGVFSDMNGWAPINFSGGLASGVVIPIIVSPAGFLGFITYFFTAMFFYGGTKFVYVYMFIAIAMSLIYLFIGYRLFLRRKSEKIGNPFVFRGVNSVLQCLVVFVLVLLGFTEVTGNPDVASPVIFLPFSLIVFILLEVISGRSGRKGGIIIPALRYTAVVVLTVCMLRVVKMTDYLGLEKYVPSQSSVNSIGIQVEPSFIVQNVEVILSETENIECVRNLHSELIEKNSGANTLNLKYNLRFGISSCRMYDYDENVMFSEDMFKLISSEEYIDKMLQSYKYPKNIDGKQNHFKLLCKARVSNNDSSYSVEKYDISAEFFNRLKEAIKADILGMSYEEYCAQERYCTIVAAPEEFFYLSDGHIQLKANSTPFLAMLVPASFTETISVLNEKYVPDNSPETQKRIFREMDAIVDYSADVYTYDQKRQIMPSDDGGVCVAVERGGDVYYVSLDENYYDLIIYCEKEYTKNYAAKIFSLSQDELYVPEKYGYLLDKLTLSVPVR